MRGEQLGELVGVSLVGLRDLPVERCLAFRAQPGRDQPVESRGREPDVAGTGDVGTQCAL